MDIKIKYRWYEIDTDTGKTSEPQSDYNREMGIYKSLPDEFDSEFDAVTALNEFITEENAWKFDAFTLVKIYIVSI
jgi:hypothetical protein